MIFVFDSSTEEKRESLFMSRPIAYHFLFNILHSLSYAPLESPCLSSSNGILIKVRTLGNVVATKSHLTSHAVILCYILESFPDV